MDQKTAEYMEERAKKFRKLEKCADSLEHVAECITNPGAALYMANESVMGYIGGGRTAAFRAKCKQLLDEEIVELKKEMEEI